MDTGGGFLQINYDSTNALGVADGPETIAYTGYNSGTGAVTGVTRAQAGTTAVSHSNGAPVACGTSSMYSLNGTTLGYAQITATFTTAATPTITDITGLSVLVTVPAGGRRIKITGWASYLATDTNVGNLGFYIREGSTTLANTLFTTSAAGNASPQSVMYSTVPSVGSHTYKLSFSQSAAGTLSCTATATSPAFILVELI